MEVVLCSLERIILTVTNFCAVVDDFHCKFLQVLYRFSKFNSEQKDFFEVNKKIFHNAGTPLSIGR